MLADMTAAEIGRWALDGAEDLLQASQVLEEVLQEDPILVSKFIAHVLAEVASEVEPRTAAPASAPAGQNGNPAPFPQGGHINAG